jgi:hypothetical protein
MSTKLSLYPGQKLESPKSINTCQWNEVPLIPIYNKKALTLEVIGSQF